MIGKKIVAATFAAALLGGTGLLAPSALRADEAGYTDYVGAAAQKADEAKPNPMKLSQEGYVAMRAVRGARIAIFNGEPQMADKMLETAKKAIEAAEKQASDSAAKSEADAKGSGTATASGDAQGSVDLVPIDGKLLVADDFVVTPEKKGHVDTANEHFEKGEHEKAIEELRLAEIDVTYQRVLMPLASTRKNIESALSLEKDHKYYEANLALKDAEDGLVVDTVSLIGPVPADGSAPADSTKTGSGTAKSAPGKSAPADATKTDSAPTDSVKTKG